MAEKKINGKTIEEINQMLQEAFEEDYARKQKLFDQQWELLKEEIARQEEEQIVRQWEDQEFGRLDLEDYHFGAGQYHC